MCIVVINYITYLNTCEYKTKIIVRQESSLKTLVMMIKNAYFHRSRNS